MSTSISSIGDKLKKSEEHKSLVESEVQRLKSKLVKNN